MSPNLLSLAAPTSAAAPPLDECSAFAKQERLLASLRDHSSLLIAFSGGADSAYLAWAAHRAIGARALCVTALSASYSRHDREHAERFVLSHSIRHEFVETHEFANPLYIANNADRCYHCKDELFTQLDAIAHERGFSAIAYGINADDTRDFRPGHRAAREHRVLAPLLDAGLTKAEIRHLSRLSGLGTWDRPASPCLSSRIPYGTAVTSELLERIERAEAAVRILGFRQFRVRAHGANARLELSRDELVRGIAPEMSQALADSIARAGFAQVTIDPEGYRQGSLNSALIEAAKAESL
ncbi:MAG TPA: ATP-dependent sacrificial sulfur transferase LarE [Candidatus Acidoferrum sp.]|nr:ATP-dependent sacrificial sulfur transferase LarE [Candidatus Acidoferrum sp.]